MSAEPKRCTCCQRTYSPAQWDALPLLGKQLVPGEPSLILKNCASCDSTLAVEEKP